jgi:Type IV secretion system pilin
MKKLALTKISAVSAAVMAFIMPAIVFAQGTNFEDFQTASGGGTTPLVDMIGGIVNVIMGLLGVVAVLVILYGGFMWMTAAGNEEKVTKAKKLIIAGIIGLVVIFAAFAIAQFVIGNLATQGGATVN